MIKDEILFEILDGDELVMVVTIDVLGKYQITLN